MPSLPLNFRVHCGNSGNDGSGNYIRDAFIIYNSGISGVFTGFNILKRGEGETLGAQSGDFLGVALKSLVASGDISLTSNSNEVIISTVTAFTGSVTTSASAGGVTVPATASGFVFFDFGGNKYKIPLYGL